MTAVMMSHTQNGAVQSTDCMSLIDIHSADRLPVSTDRYSQPYVTVLLLQLLYFIITTCIHKDNTRLREIT